MMIPLLHKSKLKKIYEVEVALLIIILIISGIAHGYNMFSFPFFENDEGTYLAQAWSVLTRGQLAPYTYWYDHAPLGWIFTSLWLFLTGGLFSFGFSLFSGRIFMLLIHLFSTAFLFKITRKITDSNFAAVVSCLFFSISPLAIYFQRRLLLDNLMIFWILLSLLLILYARHHLKNFLVSAIFFGIAVLTKENAIFWLPAFVWIIHKESHSHNKLFVVLKWITIAGMIISIYPLFALLKDELFPSNSFLSSSLPHVSLMGTLSEQASRGSGLPFWESESDFILNLHYWYEKDPLFIMVGFLSLFIQTILSFISQKSRIISVLTISMLLFFLSGKLVINFYVIALIPFLAMCIGNSLNQILRIIKDQIRLTYFPVLICFFILTGYYYFNHTQEPLLRDETSKQIEAINWIKKNIDPIKCISIDFYGYEDLVGSRFLGDPRFTCAEWFWKIELDSDIREKKLQNDPKNIDYIMVTAEVQRQLKGFPENDSMLRKALSNSKKIVEFSSDPTFNFTLDLYDQKYPNGDWVVIYEQNFYEELLANTWNTYVKQYIDKSGKTIDPNRSGITTSEGQSYSMLRAVWMNDRDTFNRVWEWTKKNLQNEIGTFGWKWGKDESGIERLLDKGSATDADTDIALALALANKKWGTPTYRDEAHKVINGIWESEVKLVDGAPYIVAGNWAKEKSIVITNPSYLAPYAYRIFALIDKNHAWEKLIDTSYEVLSKCTQAKLDKVSSINLPPDWCGIDAQGNAIKSTEEGLNSTNYSYDAIRTMWRIALDYKWNNEPRAKDYLMQSGTFLKSQWRDNKKISVAYTHDGNVQDNYESAMSYAANLSNFVITDKQIADEIYEKQIKTKFYEESRDDTLISYWEDENNYYTQNIVWFNVALYADLLENYWKN